jgi:CRP-like cAMP-binding protein
MSEPRFLNPREVLFKEGENAEKLYLIQSGEVLCLKFSKDRLIPVFKAQAEDIIGESAMLKDGVHSYSAVCLDQVQAVEIPNVNFTEALSEAPDWLIDLTATMISRFQSTAKLIAENRAIHSSIISDEEFTPAFEVEMKRILN